MSAAQGAVGVAGVGGRHIETPVVIGQHTLQHVIGLVDGLRFGQTQLLDPAILGRAERAFHAAFGLRTVSLDQVDVQLGQGPAELRFALVVDFTFLVRLEDAVPIAVQRTRPAMLLHPASQQIEVRLGGVRRIKTREHQ